MTTGASRSEGAFRIGIVTTTRAEYGLLYWLIEGARADPQVDMSLYVTGSHLSAEHGHTVDQIEADGVPIARRLPIHGSSDSPSGATDAAGAAARVFGRAFAEDRPDIVVLLGDRYEIVPIALAAVLHSVPVAHIHGGELSAGALDEYFRHAVTKLASLHFPATEEYRRRILQLGEAPDRVITVGAPGLDHVHRTPLLTQRELGATLGVSLARPTALVTYHPVTTEPGTSEKVVTALIDALLAESELQAVFTKANADVEGRTINRLLTASVRRHPERFVLFDNLGVRSYLSCLRHVDVLIGNSSSGLIEAPTFALPVVNIGSRQDGRTRAANVIDVRPTLAEISDGIRVARSDEFRTGLEGMVNPYDTYGDGRASHRMLEAIKQYLSKGRRATKTFVDQPGVSSRG